MAVESESAITADTLDFALPNSGERVKIPTLFRQERERRMGCNLKFLLDAHGDKGTPIVP